MDSREIGGVIVVERKKNLIFAAVLIVAVSVAFWIGNVYGYKTGQLDYARDKIEYTIIDGRIIHILGDAPLPETKLHPIKE